MAKNGIGQKDVGNRPERACTTHEIGNDPMRKILSGRRKLNRPGPAVNVDRKYLGKVGTVSG
jgi:hypothetical protein